MQGKLSILTLGLGGYCTIIASLVLVFFLTPMMQFGGGPFGMGQPPNIPDDILEELKAEIYESESVITFKDTFPDYREDIKEEYGVQYTIQSRNDNTSNILSLNINYHPMGPPGSTEKFQSRSNLQCIPGEGVIGSGDMMNQMFRGMNDDDLFIHETIKNSNCLDDDWEPVMVIDKPHSEHP